MNSVQREPRRVAVVGAGIAGLSCARILQASGLAVSLFDKGRAPGGRVSTRRVGANGFDLGAQYFTASHPAFLREVESLVAAGHCAPWSGRIASIHDGAIETTTPVPRWVGVPGMSQLPRGLAQDLTVFPGHRVDRLLRGSGALQLQGARAEAGATLGPTPERPDARAQEVFGDFDAVLVCVPAPQAVTLLSDVSVELASVVSAVAFDPCFAVAILAAGPALLDLSFDAAFVGRAPHQGSPLAWIACESSKPGRSPGGRWVLHASPAWSRAHLAAEPSWVGAELLAAFRALPGLAGVAAEVCVVHRWLLARPATGQGLAEPVFDPGLRVGAAGDWCGAGNIEAAYMAGAALAERVLATP
jgi:renalase